MASTSETGHARNIANFNQVIAICTRIGADYKPSNNNLKLARIQQLYTVANNAKTTLDGVMPAWSLAVTNREEAFEMLPKLMTRIVSYLASSGVSDGVMADVKSITRKISKMRSSKNKTTTATQENAPTEQNTANTSPEHHSDSHRSYDNLVSNFYSLIQLLSAIPDYHPEEDALKTTALTAVHGTLSSHNTAVVNAYQPVATARKLRDTYLYAPEIGIVDTYKKIKAYTKALKGTSSQEYKDLVKLKFSEPKKPDHNLSFTLVEPS